MKKKLLLLLCIMVVISIAGAIIIINSNPKTQNSVNQEKTKIQVVTSFYPMYIIGINLTVQAKDIEVKNLTNYSTGCLHDYQLTTQDLKTLATADVFIMNGGGMESFIEDVIKNYPQIKVIDASQGITMINEEAAGKEPIYNPHVWLDPKLYMKQIENVRDGLLDYLNDSGSGLKDTAQTVENNAKTYMDKVIKLDNEIEDSLLKGLNSNGQAVTNEKVIIFHEAFAYLADRIGLTVAQAVETGTDTALNAGEIADIIDMVQKDNIQYLFTERQYGASIAERIEAETGATVYVIDSGVTGDGTKDSYLDAMHYNLKVLQEALQ